MPIESEEQIIDLFVQKMDEVKDIDFAIIDHISSASALVFPISKYTCGILPYTIDDKLKISPGQMFAPWSQQYINLHMMSTWYVI